MMLAELRDDEATHQVESTQLAAVEIERLAEEKQRLAEHLQQEASTIAANDKLLVSIFYQVGWHFLVQQ